MFERNDRLVVGSVRRPLSEGAVLGVIFAGGASRRYGQDKAAARLGGVPLLRRVADRLGPQVNALVISGQARPEISAVNIPDKLQSAGPLAALCSVLQVAGLQGWPMVATVSCDTPFIPINIVAKLGAMLNGHDCSVASRHGVPHPTCALWATRAFGKIQAAFDTGARSLHSAISSLDMVEVDFSAEHYGPGGDPFFNINSQADMAVAHTWLAERFPTS